MPADLLKARELFLHAVGKLPPEQWAGYVAEACGGDAELEQQVGHLLRIHREAGSFLERPAAAGVTVTAPPQSGGTALHLPTSDDAPGTVIGPYKLLQQLGEGGMGTVFMAEQTHPVQRKVALKLIKAGMDSKPVLARFEAERQALALMDHPNIAKVFDAGTTDRGLPYFVMELVKGVPITTYCDDHHLTCEERLGLFVQVCHAVQHAHQKGIIHRDIKPSNVMVCLYDGKPVPKVIDFGIAKATGQKLTDRTLFTEVGAVVGTLQYMSPEQAEVNQLDVDTRSDVYSLGVLLYELLTGTTPLERKRLKEVTFLEVLRLIREEEPPRPSTRLSTSQGLPAIAANRGLEPRRLNGVVRGELDWISMRALEKDRSRRYDTANGFAADVQRYLNDETVQACPPSVGYRLRKFVRRNKGPVAAAGLVLLTLVGGIAGTAWGLVRAEHQRQLAEAKKQEALDERDAKDAALKAEQQARADETKARQQAFAALRSLATDAYEDAVMKLLTDLDPPRQQEDFQKLIAEVVVLAKARYYIRRSQWDKAAAEYAKADLWARPVGDDAFAYACLFLIREDSEGYNRFCQSMAQRAAKSDGPEAYILARACAMARNSPVDPARAVQWANQAVASNSPWDFHVLGLAQYRAGQFDPALQSLTKANVKAWRYADLNWFGLALVHHRLGHPDEARQCLDKGIQWLERAGPPGAGRPTNLPAQDWLEAQILRREAEELLRANRSP